MSGEKRIGRLIAVVGPSGVGKDSLIAALAAARPELGVVRRAVTRAPGLGGEDYDALTEADFARLRDAGRFCLWWTAHGLSYGVPAEAAARARAGVEVVANLSRGVLAEAARVFPRVTVLTVTATPETLARRLAARGREGGADIAARLARAAAPFPDGLDVAAIANDGPIEAAVAQALAALGPVRA
jgi:ribose 1,5-bisphosphokinase